MLHFLKKLISSVLAFSLALQPVLILAQEAPTTLDPLLIAEPGQTLEERPHVDEANNGVPIINITTPRDDGVSYNEFIEFNVGEDGLIFNNSATNVDTEIGGWIEGNPNLTPGNESSIILNDVTGINQSVLEGIMEIGGKKADLIIANENGILCNACGFINTDRITLSTGTPEFDANNHFQSLNVQQGSVVFGSGGMNANNISRVDIIARAIEVYGEVRTNVLNVYTGPNQFGYHTGTVTPIEGQSDVPALALDVAYLGGMYASSIYLMATEKGVGVNIDGDMISSNNLTLDIDGNLKVGKTGVAKAQKKVSVKTQQDTIIEGSLISVIDDIEVNSNGGISISGESNGQTIQLSSAGSINLSGTIEAHETLKAIASGENLVFGGTVGANEILLEAAGDLTLQAVAKSDQLFQAKADGTISGQNGEITAETIKITSKGNIELSSKMLAQQDLEVLSETGLLTLDGELKAGLIKLSASKNVSVTASLETTNETVLSEISHIMVTSSLGSVDFTGTANTKSMKVTAQTGQSLGGNFVVSDLFSATSSSGDISASGQVKAGQILITTDEKISISGVLDAVNDVTLSSISDEMLIDESGSVSGNTVNMKSSGQNEIKGSVQADTELKITSTTKDILVSGSIKATSADLKANTALVFKGKSEVNGLLSLVTEAGNVEILSAIKSGYLNIDSSDEFILSEAIEAEQDLNIIIGTSNETIINGMIYADKISLSAVGDITNKNLIQAHSSLFIQTDGKLTNQLVLYSTGSMTLYASNVINQYNSEYEYDENYEGPVIWAKNDIIIRKNSTDWATLIHNDGGRIESYEGDIYLSADTVLNEGQAPTVEIDGNIEKWQETGNAPATEPEEEIIKLIDPTYLDSNGSILAEYAHLYTELWETLLTDGIASEAVQEILKSSAHSNGTITSDFMGVWTQMKGRANEDGVTDVQDFMRDIIDGDAFDEDGNIKTTAIEVIEEIEVEVEQEDGTFITETQEQVTYLDMSYSEAYAQIWDALAKGEDIPQSIVDTGILNENTYNHETNTLSGSYATVWTDMTASSGASYPILYTLYQDILNDDGRLATIAAGKSISILGNNVSNIYGDIAAGQDITISATGKVINRGLGASQTLVEVHKRPDCFTCHEATVEYHDTFGGMIKANGNISISSTQDFEHETIATSDLTANLPTDAHSLEIHEHAEQTSTGEGTLEGDEQLPVERVDDQVQLKNEMVDALTSKIEGDLLDQLPDDFIEKLAESIVANFEEDFIQSNPAIDIKEDGVVNLPTSGPDIPVETRFQYTDYNTFLQSEYMIDRQKEDPAYRFNSHLGLLQPDLESISNLDLSDILSEAIVEVFENPSEQALPNLNIPDIPTDLPELLSANQPKYLNQGATLAAVGIDINSNQDINLEGNILAQEDILLASGGDLISENTSFLAENNLIIASAGDAEITNGNLNASHLALLSDQDIKIAGSDVAVEGDALVMAANDLNITSIEKKSDYGTGFRGTTKLEIIDQDISSLSIGGSLKLESGNDTLLQAVDIVSGGTTDLITGGDLIMKVATESREVIGLNRRADGANTHLTRIDIHEQNHISTSIQSGADLNIQVGGDLSSEATQMNSEGAAFIVAEGDIDLKSITEINKTTTTKETKFSFFFLKKRQDIDDRSQNLGNKIESSGDLVIVSGGQASAKNADLASDTGKLHFITEGDIIAQNSRMAAGIDLALASTSEGAVNLEGTHLSSKNDLSVSGGDVTLGGNSQANSTTLTSDGTLNIISDGSIVGGISSLSGDDVILSAAKEVVLEATTRRKGSGNGQDQFIGTSNIRAENDLNIISGEGTSIRAANLNAGNDIDLQSQGTINIVSEYLDYASGHSNNKSTGRNRISSVVNAGNNLQVTALGDANIGASNLRAGNDLIVMTDGSTNIYAEEEFWTYYYYRKKKNFWRTKITQISRGALTHVASQISSGGDLKIQSGNNIAVAGSHLLSENEMTLIAANEYLKNTVLNSNYSSYYKKRSFFFNLFGSSRHTINTNATHQGSVAESFKGVAIGAGGNVTLVGSQIINHSGDVNIQAGVGENARPDANVNILSATDSSSSFEEYKEQSLFDFSGGVFYLYKDETERTTTSQTTNLGSQITNENGDINISATQDVNVIGSQIDARTDANELFQNQEAQDIASPAAANVITTNAIYDEAIDDIISLQTFNDQSQSASQISLDYINDINTQFELGQIKQDNLPIGFEIDQAGALKMHEQFYHRLIDKAYEIDLAAAPAAETVPPATETTIPVTASSEAVALNDNTSHFSSTGNVNISAGRDINILAGRESYEENYFHEVKGIGIELTSTDTSVSLFAGYLKDVVEDDFKGNYTAGSTIAANNNLTLTAENNIISQGSDLFGAMDVTIRTTAGDFITLAGVNTEALRHYEEHLRIGLTTTIGSPALDAAKQIKDGLDTIGNGEGSGINSLITDASGVLKAAEGASSLSDILSGGGSIASISLSAGYSHSETETTNTSETARVSTITAGHNLDVDVAGDMDAQGTQIFAGNEANLNVAGDLSLESVENQYTATEETNSSSASIGLTVGVGLTGGVSVGMNANFGMSESEMDSTGTQNVSAQISSGGDLNVSTGGDLNLQGSNLDTGGTGTIDVAGNLNIESRQDTSTYDRDSWGLNLGLNLGGGSGQAGQLGDIVEGVTSNPSADSLSIGGSFGKGEGESHWVETQAGISGDTLNIDVEGNTNLKGGTIIAENEEASSLETGTLTHSNIADKHIREDIDVSANIGIGGNGLSGSVDGGYEFTAREQDNKATANIEITITDEEAQDQLVEDGVTEDLAALNTDPDQAQVITRDERNAVDFYVSDQAVKAMIEAGALLKDIIAEILDREGFGALGQAVSDGQLSAKDALDQLKACQTSSQQGFNLYEIFITTAHAAECVLTTVTGKDIVVSDVDGCAKAIIKAAFTAAWNGRTSAPALAEGIKNGLIKEGEQYLELLSDPAALASAMTEFAYQAWKDPSKLAELGINIVDGMQTNAYEYLAAMVAEDYEKAGEHMAALTLDLAIKIIAPAAGASLSALAAIKGMDKIISATRRVAPKGGLPIPDRRVEITELFDSSNPRTGIQIGNRTVLNDSTNRGGAKVFDGVSDAEVKDYFTQLTGEALPAPRTISIGNNSNVQLYTVHTPEGSFNLRSGSSSGVGRWTIDVPSGATGTGNAGELKFR